MPERMGTDALISSTDALYKCMEGWVQMPCKNAWKDGYYIPGTVQVLKSVWLLLSLRLLPW